MSALPGIGGEPSRFAVTSREAEGRFLLFFFD